MGEYKNRIAEYQTLDNTESSIAYPLKGLHIELSNICNHQCLFCANRKMTRKKGFIDEKLLIRILKEAYEEGFREVGFYSNGEPFMSKNLGEYIKWAKEIGYTYVYIDTNGGSVEFSTIKEVLDVGLDSIKFSINGTNRENYKLIHGRDDFDRVMNNLRKTYKYKQTINNKLKVFVSIAITRFVENTYEKFVEECKKHCDEVLINSVIEMGGYINEEMKLISTSIDFSKGMSIPCYMLWNGVFVTYEGYLTACCADFQNYFVYADLNRDSLREAWNNEYITKLRKRHLKGDIEGMPCVSCVAARKCKWEPLREEYATICDEKVIGKYDIEDRIKQYKEVTKE